MGTPTSPNEATRIAIEFLTLWLRTDPGAREETMAYIKERLCESGTADPETVIGGHLNLAMLLLLRCAVQESADPDHLYDDAHAILQQMATTLPDDT